MTIEDALKLDNGARFFRGDLHVHSVTGSHDVKDTTATSAALVQAAHAEGLSILAIADHNEISAVALAVSTGDALGMLVVPAVELSTQHGHVLCYLPTVTALTRFHAKLAFAEAGTQNSRCTTGIIEILDALKAEAGFAILAHVDGGKGLETVLPGNPPHKKDIICHAA
ncbi:MAG: PHP-like protein, partial [Alphaproteobacteria bacterium]|nr:PHP-like protein [Alphaproteobacteria bacterium]